MNHYETVFIMTPVLSDDQVKEAVKKYLAFLKENGAEIVFEESWGLKKLAYPIQKKNNGFYHLVEFTAEGNVVDLLETAFRRDEKLIRFLTVKLDKFAVAYNERKHAQKKAERTEKTENSKTL